MDFKNPRITQFFNHKDKTGIINFLEGTAEMENILTILPDNTNLFFASAGTKGGDHTKLLLNGKLEELFKYLEDRFEFIIIDSAPISLVSDANLFDEFSDETLLVIRHAYTPKLLIQRLDKVIKSKSLHNVSLVYNGVKRRGMVNSSYNYGYGYGNTYGYGGKYSMFSSK
jgi:Mrp family chromosome partitioning ATPase